MKKNMGGIDKAIRLIIAMLVAVLYFTGIIKDTTAIILGGVAIILALTSLINFCPLYTILGINTCKAK
jgi:hypothetical protein